MLPLAVGWYVGGLLWCLAAPPEPPTQLPAGWLMVLLIVLLLLKP